MENKIKRFLSLAIAIVMVFSMLPVTSFAAETTTTEVDFTCGNDGDANHWEGTEVDIEYTVDSYTLSFTSKVNVNKARDAKGNGCFRVGKQSETGSFTFTVPNDVTGVVIAVAQYKANDTKVSVNGEESTISTASNDGSYTNITVDTTTDKTVSFATLENGTRAMINTITYVIETKAEPEPHEHDWSNKDGVCADETCGEKCQHQNTVPEYPNDYDCTQTYEVTYTCECGVELTMTLGGLEAHTFVDGVCVNDHCTAVETVVEPDTSIDSEDEFYAALRTGGEYVLNVDVNLPTHWSIAQDITLVLDLNSHTISGGSGGEFGCIFNNAGNLTIKGSGKLNADGNCIRNFGTLTITGGEFTAVLECVNQMVGTVTITGGTFNTGVSDYVAEGYVQNEDGSVTVAPAEPEAPEAPKTGNTTTLVKMFCSDNEQHVAMLAFNPTYCEVTGTGYDASQDKFWANVTVNVEAWAAAVVADQASLVAGHIAAEDNVKEFDVTLHWNEDNSQWTADGPQDVRFNCPATEEEPDAPYLTADENDKVDTNVATGHIYLFGITCDKEENRHAGYSSVAMAECSAVTQDENGDYFCVLTVDQNDFETAWNLFVEANGAHVKPEFPEQLTFTYKWNGTAWERQDDMVTYTIGEVADAPEVVIPTSKPENITVEDEIYNSVIEFIENNNLVKEQPLSEGVTALTIELQNVEKNATTGAVKVTFDVNPERESDEIEVTFYLPVDSAWEKVNVYHGEKLLDAYTPKGDSNGKYVEVTSKSFSPYAVEEYVEDSDTLSYEQFNELIRNAEGGIYDGNDITVVLKDSERSYQNNKTAQFFIGATNVNITDPVETVKVSNVNFVFEDDDTTNIYTSGELQVFANYIEFTSCTFEGVAVSPWGISNSENAETAVFTDCEWTNLSGRYGVHQNRAANLTVTECEFNCERGIHTNSSTVSSITITNNTFTGIGDDYGVLCLAEGNGDLSKATLNITGNTAENQVMLRQLSSTLTYEQASAILDTEKNTYGTAYVEESIVPTKPVAMIGTKGYATLQAAIDAAAASGETVMLIDDVVITEIGGKDSSGRSYGVTVTSGQTVTLDLAGHSITSKIVDTQIDFFTIYVNSGNLTVNDSVGGGAVICDSNTTATAKKLVTTLTNYSGTVVLNGGTFDNKATTNGSRYTIDSRTTHGDASLTINAGTTINSTDYQAVRSCVSDYHFKNTLVITGGTITGKGGVWLQNADGTTNKVFNTVVTITGGTVNGGDWGALDISGTNNWTATVVAISGVTLNGNFVTDNGSAAFLAEAKPITGGTFTTDISAYVADGYKIKDNGDGTYSVVEGPKGTVTLCYTDANSFWGEATSNASESLIISLCESEKVIATASLNDVCDIIDGTTKLVTWHINFHENNDEYWDVKWAEGYPNIDMAPTAVKLIVDGKEVATNNCQWNWADNLNPIIALAEDKEGNFLGAYTALATAAAAENVGEIKLVNDATLTEALTLPAGVIFNGNGKTVNGEIKASGDLTIKGHVKVATFGAGSGNTITIGEGACLEIIGTGRMVIGHGNTFNITGTITDAKTANVAELNPSLIMPGASFTGAGVTFNVKNAYIKPSAYCSSKNSNASGTFIFNITNSIWEQTGSLVFSVPTNGMDPTVNFNLKDSVLTTTSHLVFGISKGAVDIDNSNVNVGTSRQIENQSTMTVKNGSVVNGAVATSSNAKNPGTLIVDNATYAVTGEFSGSDLGTGTLQVNKDAKFTAGKITKANIVIDATGMTAGEVTMITADLSNFTGTIEAIGETELLATIDADGNIVLVEPVAKIGNTGYQTVADALAAAKDGDTIKLVSGENVISMAGSVVGGKTVTITGTAIVDWTQGNLFIGRGGEGDGKVIFDGATITSYAKILNAATGIHVSGNKPADDTCNNGVLVIKNSNIELDYLINRNETTVEENSKLTVYGGCYTHGRGENHGGVAGATATMTIDAGSTVIAVNANGMGVGSNEGNGVMTVMGTYESNYLPIASTGTVNVEGGSLKIDGDLTVSGVLESAGNIDGNIVAKEGAQITVYGGTYTMDVTEWCAEGYMAVDNEDGTFTVKADREAMIVGTSGVKYYSSLAEAVAAAKEGQTVIIQANIVLDEVLIIDKNLTIADYGALKISAVEGGAIYIKGSKNLTLDEVVINAPVYGDSPAGATINDKLAVTGTSEHKSTVTSDGETEVVVKNPEWKVLVNEAEYFMDLATAIAAADAGETVTMLADIEIADKIVITKNLVLDGGNHTLTYTGTYTGENRAIDIPNTANGANVTIKNLTIDAETANRGINYNTNGTLIVDNVKVTIGADVDGYAINFPSSADNATVTISNSELSSRNPVNVWGSDMEITITNTAITSVDNSTTYWYSAIQLNNDNDVNAAEGTVVDVIGGSITAKDEVGEPSYAVTNWTKTGTVNISDTTVVNGKIENVVAWLGGVGFVDLQSAIDTVVEGTLSGTIQIIRDVVATEPVMIPEDASIAIDLDKDTKLEATFELAEGATLTAAEGLNVTTKVEGMAVAYENGTYVLKAPIVEDGAILIQNNEEKIRITVDITADFVVESLEAELYDQNGDLLTTVTPNPENGETMGEVLGQTTLGFMIKGDSSSWDQTDWTPNAAKRPDSIKVYINGEMVAEVDVHGQTGTDAALASLTQEDWEALVGAPLTGSIKLSSGALNLMDEIHIIYSAKIEAIEKDVAERGVLLYESAELAASKDPSEAYETVELVWDETKQEYRGETKGIDARDMGNSQFAVAYMKMADGTYIFGTKDGAEQIVEYSPLIYCRNMKEDAQVGMLCRALMHYGAAAQVEQYGQTENLMNEGFEAVPYDASVLGDSVFSADTAVVNGMKLKSGAMDLKGAISYIIRFEVEEGIADKQLYAEYTLLGETGSVALETDEVYEGQLRATIKGIPAKDMSATLKVKAYYLDENGEKVYGGELVYSGYEYIRRAQTSTSYTEEVKALAKALAMYIHYADEYGN